MLHPDIFWYAWILLLVIVFQIMSIDGVPKQLSTDIPRLLIISLDGSTKKIIWSLVEIVTFTFIRRISPSIFQCALITSIESISNWRCRCYGRNATYIHYYDLSESYFHCNRYIWWQDFVFFYSWVWAIIGMYQDQHGIIHNAFYDQFLKKKISMGSYLSMAFVIVCKNDNWTCFSKSWWRTMVWSEGWTDLDHSN